jgi:Uncharacterized conserved protein
MPRENDALMKKISGSIGFQKKVLPFLWIGFLVLFMVTVAAKGEFGEAWWPFVATGAVVAFASFFVVKKAFRDLMDEVLDGGDFLLIRKGGEEERVPLSNVMHVDTSRISTQARITLRLVKPGRFGSEISFALPARFSFSAFAKHPVTEDLIARVDKARRHTGS